MWQSMHEECGWSVGRLPRQLHSSRVGLCSSSCCVSSKFGRAGSDLQAHVVHNGFPAGAEEYKATVQALGLSILALVVEVY